MDAKCNEPRCPLNRRGVFHRPHEAIERDEVVDPCNDPQCALTRLGMPHNSHGLMDGPATRPCGPDGPEDGGRGAGETGGGTGGPGKGGRGAGETGGGTGGPGKGSADPAGAGRAPNGGNAGRPWDMCSPTSPEDILDEAARHLRERRAEAGSAAGRGRSPRPGGRRLRERRAEAGSAAQPAACRPSRACEEAERILHASDPHDILGVPPGAAISHVRSCYKGLVKRHDAARGIIHKSALERERSSMIMAKINGAFEAIKAARGAPG